MVSIGMLLFSPVFPDSPTERPFDQSGLTTIRAQGIRRITM